MAVPLPCALQCSSRRMAMLRPLQRWRPQAWRVRLQTWSAATKAACCGCGAAVGWLPVAAAVVGAVVGAVAAAAGGAKGCCSSASRVRAAAPHPRWRWRPCSHSWNSRACSPLRLPFTWPYTLRPPQLQQATARHCSTCHRQLKAAWCLSTWGAARCLPPSMHIRTWCAACVRCRTAASRRPEGSMTAPFESGRGHSGRALLRHPLRTTIRRWWCAIPSRRCASRAT
mmetsp:Transcript_42425/g.105651  ORF Transcript_42425/g.105651 Transcript_42425/m.105651 type:complete len:227 (+) Transcript_42425:978-1658(+)